MPHHFSSRLKLPRAPNRLTGELERIRRSGAPLCDLTLSNPTAAELGCYDAARLGAALGSSGAARYRPEPLGALAAREAVARELSPLYDADALVLTASTSEAYSLLFKLLCDPGDAVLVPCPSYPLLEHLARLDGVVPVPYRLRYAGGWQIDLESLTRGLGPRVRAVVLVSPNNPTGSFVSEAELAALAAACGERVALIADEVFVDYVFGGVEPARVAKAPVPLSFGLGGLSKSAGLPQLKLAWIGIAGSGPLCRRARQRLELVADMYLSVATPVQLAAAELLAQGRDIRRAIHGRVCGNRLALAERVAGTACTLLRADGGWYAVLQVPALRGEEELALELLLEDGVLVHPGHFFDFEREAYVVLSLLPPPATFAEGVERLLRRAAAVG